jgi:hypothetical protein
MAGDYTRFTFKPQRDYSGVFKQQGRVDLDADCNELIEIIDRRWRSETIDIINHCTVPRVPPGTPPVLDPFLIIPTAMGAFDIGIGRMYVDGIQVENHGLPPLAYQADLGERRGTQPIPYNNQPYLRAPLPPALAAVPNTTDLVYIDVWQREVTVLEDPSLREIALGGPDTTTRMQSVWQVRVLENVGQHGCGDNIAVWDQTIAPSAGRLTTSAVAPPASDDPCIISPTGGYRGLENRLYRVEIHSTGPIGGGAPAKFKWSRNNATVASTISAIPSPTQVAVQGKGILSANFFTHVEQNSLQCPRVAIKLDAAFCTARNNSLIGIATEPAPADEGLLILHGAARRSIVSGNRLFNAAGHAILLREDLLDVAIEENHIEVARRFGIGTFSDTTALRRSSISRNRVQGCVGDVPAGSLQFGGAVVIGESQEVRFIDNVITANTPLTPGDQFLRWVAVYFEDADRVEISGNTVTGNATQEGLGGALGAIALLGASGTIRIQNNVVRNNGGIALAIGEGRVQQVQQALVQNNHFSEGPNQSFLLVGVLGIDSLLFQGNHCLGTAREYALPPVLLYALPRANVTGNVVDLAGATAMGIVGQDLVVSANSVRSGESALTVSAIPIAPGPVRTIVTSNLATGILASSTGVLVRASNLPAP